MKYLMTRKNRITHTSKPNFKLGITHEIKNCWIVLASDIWAYWFSVWGQFSEKLLEFESR